MTDIRNDTPTEAIHRYLNDLNTKLARLTERLDDLDRRHQRDTQETGAEVDNLYRRLSDRDRSRR